MTIKKNVILFNISIRLGSEPAPYFHSNVSGDGSFIGRSWIKWCNGTGKGSLNHSSNSIYFDSIFSSFSCLGLILKYNVI